MSKNWCKWCKTCKVLHSHCLKLKEVFHNAHAPVFSNYFVAVSKWGWSKDNAVPNFYAETLKGNFPFSKTGRQLSRMGINQVHDHNNKVIKNLGGANQLLNCTEDSSLITWEISGPEVVQIVSKLGETIKSKHSVNTDKPLKQQEDTSAFEIAFINDLWAFYKKICYSSFELNKLAILTLLRMDVLGVTHRWTGG